MNEEIKEVIKVYIQNDIFDKDDENSSRCKICITLVNRARYTMDLRYEKHLENEQKFEMIPPECLFQDLFKNKTEKIIIQNH